MKYYMLYEVSTYYNTDELGKHYAKWKKSHIWRTDIVWFNLHKMSRMGNTKKHRVDSGCLSWRGTEMGSDV